MADAFRALLLEQTDGAVSATLRDILRILWLTRPSSPSGT